MAFDLQIHRFTQNTAVFAVILMATISLVSPAIASKQGLTLNAPAKIAMVIYGPIYDGGWSTSFNEARLRMEDTLGMPIAYAANVGENESRVIVAVDHFVAEGHNIIIGTANEFSRILEIMAERHPDVAFLNAAGSTNGPNLQSFYGRSFESQYLCGMLAGLKSQYGKLGFVAGKNVAVVHWAINGFTLGARQTHPDSTVSVRYTDAWADPRAEQMVSRDLIKQGAEVLGQHVDTPTPQKTAQEMGVFSTGHHRDQSYLTPDTTLCSSVWVWDRYLVPEIRKIMAGGWVPKPYGELPEFKNGPADISINEELVPSAWANRVMAERQLLIDGKKIFTGPMRDNHGVMRLADGEAMTTEDLWRMDWLIEGADDVERADEEDHSKESAKPE